MLHGDAVKIGVHLSEPEDFGPPVANLALPGCPPVWCGSMHNTAASLRDLWAEVGG